MGSNNGKMEINSRKWERRNEDRERERRREG